MTRKISLIILGIAVLFVISFIIFLFTAKNPSVPQSDTISVDGKINDIRKMGIIFPIIKDGALKIAKAFCNTNIQATFKGDVYGDVSEFDDKWYISLTITECFCGVTVDKKTGETSCYKKLSPEESVRLK